MSEQCLECDCDLELHDTTHSNINANRCYAGQHTGNIYACTNEDCCQLYLDDFLSGEFRYWSY